MNTYQAQEFNSTIMFITSIVMMGFMVGMAKNFGNTTSTRIINKVCPRPEYFTHETEYLEEVLKEGYISPLEGEISVSLDGSWGAEIGNTFLFDINELSKYKTRPVFYLGTRMFSSKSYDRFVIYDVTCIWATEIEILEPILVTKTNVATVFPETPLKAYIQDVVKELALIVEGLESKYGPPTIIPDKEIARKIHGYNKMVAEITGMNYNTILLEVEQSITKGEIDWVKWW